jgi:hypothetical protein
MVTTVYEYTDLQMSVAWKKFLIALRDADADGETDDVLHQWAKLCAEEHLDVVRQRHAEIYDIDASTYKLGLLLDEANWTREVLRKIPDRCTKTKKFFYIRLIRHWMYASGVELCKKLNQDLLTIQAHENGIVAQAIRETFQTETEKSGFNTVLLAKMCSNLIASADQGYPQYYCASVQKNDGVLSAMAKAMARYASFEDMLKMARAII